MPSPSSPDPTPARRASEAGWRQLLGRRYGAVAVTLAAGVGLHATNVYLATTVLPSVVADIGGEKLYAWATTLFVVTSVLGSTMAAAALARFGPRAAYRWSVVILTAGTLVCAVAPSMVVLLAGRAVQGFGGGLLFALSYSVVRVVLDAALWPRAMALVSAMWGVATLVGPALGGLWAQVDLWRGAFWMLVPLLVFFAFWGSMRLPVRSVVGSGGGFAAVAIVLLALAVLVISAASLSDALWVNAIGIVVAAVLLALWLRRERTAEVRVLPVATFGPDRRLRWVYATMAALVIASTVEVFVPYFGQHLQGLGPLEAGYLGAVMAAGWTAGSIACSGVTDRRALVIRTAPAFSLLGLLVLVFAGPAESHSWPIVFAVAAGLLLLGWGVGAAWPHLLADVLHLAGDRDQDVAGASTTTVQLTATAFGSACAGTVTNLGGFADPAHTADAARMLFALFLIPTVAALVFAWRSSMEKPLASA